MVASAPRSEEGGRRRDAVVSVRSARNAALVEAVRGLVGSPDGFSKADLKKALSAACAISDDQLQEWLEKRTEEGLLARLRRGRYAATAALFEDEAVSVSADLERKILAAMADAGGVMSRSELLAAIDRDGDDQDKLVWSILEGSPLYRSDLPIPGHCCDWRLTDPERLKLPIPGRKLDIDLKIAAGGRERVDHPARARRRRELIAEHLADARKLAKLSVVTVISTPEIAHEIERDFALSAYPYILDGERQTLGDWFNSEVEAFGLEHALVSAWTALEAGERAALYATSARFWRAVGARFRVCPAYLSRGTVARLSDSERLPLSALSQ
jgi:hypothetical protein